MDKAQILKIEKNELTEHIIYKTLAGMVKPAEHRRILNDIAEEELEHYRIFKNVTNEDAEPDKFKIFRYVFLSKYLGLNFGLKLMELGEELAQDVYDGIKGISPEIEAVITDEEKHERELISLIDEERLKYVSSMVLGLNDALVELTGALAGFTLALQNTKLIGMVGLITGIAAAMSMAHSEYLSTKHEKTDKNPAKASIYTGITYLATVLLLILPYFIFANMFAALGFTIFNALLVMFLFTFYTSVAQGLPFKKRFLEMSILGLSIAAINFFIGLGIRKVLGIDV